ncbi:37136_t:CDS:2 [Gigaspora margarita]|uniref:37136_t:CDS:1 n=1 Tax=Gigaspora margarita TaxID=4874 RepID=A0ABN7UKP0_GIGMA|nr:37136_t:CDS:2 [Gigaspora margarita]
MGRWLRSFTLENGIWCKKKSNDKENHDPHAVPARKVQAVKKPQTSESEEWLRYFSNLMNIIEEYKRDYEWKLVESYIDYAYIVFTEYETCELLEKKRMWRISCMEIAVPAIA